MFQTGCVMELTVEKKPKYLSYSSINNALKCPNTFYLTRLVLNPIMREPQGQPAGNGTMFDYYVKEHLFTKKFPEKLIMLPEMLKSLQLVDEMRARAEIKGKEIFQGYKNTVMRFEKLKWRDIEIDKVFEMEGVPIRVKIDATVEVPDGTDIAPFDWKVRGSETQASPTQGYYKMYDDITPCGAHSKFKHPMQMELISEDWARQLTYYGWYLGYRDKPIPGFIHEYTQTEKERPRFSLFNGYVSVEFQNKVKQEMLYVWNHIQRGTFVKLLASQTDRNLVYTVAKDEKWF